MKVSVLVVLTVLALGGAAPAPAQSAPSTAAAAEEAGVPLAQLLEAVAKRSGKKLLVDPRVAVNLPVHLYGQEISKVDYDELLVVLNLYGFTGLDQGGYVQVLPSTEVRQRGIPLVTGSENLPLALYVTTIIKVKNTSAAQLVPILRPLVSQQGHLAALPCENTLLLVDTLANVRRLKTVIEGLDTGEPRIDRCERDRPSASPPAPRPEGTREPGR